MLGIRVRGRLAKQAAQPEGQSLAVSTVAMWLVPSVSALFVVVGYVVQWAYQDLLGVAVAPADSSSYIANAAGFFRDLVTTAADAVWRLLTPGAPVSLAGYGLTLLLGALLLATALGPVRRFFPAIPHWLAAARVTFAMVVLLAGKFVFFDLPLSRIDSVIVGVGIAANTRGQQAEGKSIETRLQPSEAHHALDRIVTRRAETLWARMVCSRISDASLTPDSAQSGLIQGQGLRPRISCVGKSIAASRAFLRDVFVAHTLAAAFVLVLALQLLRSQTAMAKALGVLAAMYLLTWPYAYGKLLKSTDFEYGLVVLAFASPVDEKVTPSGAAPGEPPASGTLRHAIVLARHGGGVDLLVARRGTCADNSIYQSVKVWTVPASQLRAIQEIYREDVIAWKLLNSVSCPPAPSPYLVIPDKLNG